MSSRIFDVDCAECEFKGDMWARYEDLKAGLCKCESCGGTLDIAWRNAPAVDMTKAWASTGEVHRIEMEYTNREGKTIHRKLPFNPNKAGVN